MGSPLRRDTTRHFGSSAVPWYHRSHSTSRLAFSSSGCHALALYVLLARRAPPRAAGGRSYPVSRCVDVALPHALLRAHPSIAREVAGAAHHVWLAASQYGGLNPSHAVSPVQSSSIRVGIARAGSPFGRHIQRSAGMPTSSTVHSATAPCPLLRFLPRPRTCVVRRRRTSSASPTAYQTSRSTTSTQSGLWYALNSPLLVGIFRRLPSSRLPRSTSARAAASSRRLFQCTSSVPWCP